jgi:hypothetical protein
VFDASAVDFAIFRPPLFPMMRRATIESIVARRRVFAAMAGKMLTLRYSPEVSDSSMRFSMT